MSSEQPFKRWSDLAAQQLPGWVGKQIRNRWVNQLDPNSNHLPFSCEDNLLLWEAHKKLGTKWAEISTKLFHSIQPENQIKNCWYSASFKEFISNEFGPTAYEQSRKAATQKRAAIDIDDDGHQNKKQKYTFKGVIPTTNDPIQCRYCSNDATVSFASKLDQDNLHLCEEC